MAREFFAEFDRSKIPLDRELASKWNDRMGSKLFSSSRLMLQSTRDKSMKTITAILLMAFLLALTATMQAAQSAHATLFCWSLRFQQGTGSFDETLDLTTISGVLNGELAPWYASHTHRSDFSLDFSGFPITGTLFLNLPDFQDANGNGFDDSYEVSQAISGTSAGQYTTAVSSGTVTANWSRPAGSSAGTCVLRLVDSTYGDLGNFRHTFEVLEYTGVLSYTPGSNTVSGRLDLTQTGIPANTLQGPVAFTKSTTDRFNELTLESAFLTNATPQTLDLYEPTQFYRDLSLRTNYYGAVEFNDGDPSTSEEDYYSWELSIDDLNDSDHDGIPDFSDDPSAVVLPRRPQLSLLPGTTNLLLTVSGDVGRLHQIQETTNAAAPTWQTVLSVTLTNDPQVVSLPLPSSGTMFWRARAQ